MWLQGDLMESEKIFSLYEGLKSHRKFKDREWSGDEKPWQVLQWLIDQFKSLKTTEDWNLVAGESFQHPFFVEYEWVKKFSNRYTSIPLKPLAEMKILEPWKEVMMMILSLLLSRGVNTWLGTYHVQAMMEELEFYENDGDIDEIDEKYGDAENAIKDLKEWRDVGEKFLKKARRKVSLNSLGKLTDTLTPKRPIENKIFALAEYCLQCDAFKMNYNLGNFCFDGDNPHHEDGDPVMPTDYMLFVWDRTSNIYNNIEYDIQVSFENFGDLPPCLWKAYTKKKIVNHLKPELHHVLQELAEVYNKFGDICMTSKKS